MNDVNDRPKPTRVGAVGPAATTRTRRRVSSMDARSLLLDTPITALGFFYLLALMLVGMSGGVLGIALITLGFVVLAAAYVGLALWGVRR